MWNVSESIVAEAYQLAGNFFLVARLLWQDGSRVELHRGVLVVVVVRVRIEHQAAGEERRKNRLPRRWLAPKLLEHLHLRADIEMFCTLSKSANGEHVVAVIHLCLKFQCIAVHLFFVEQSRLRMCLVRAWLLLSDDELHPATLCSRFKALRFQCTVERKRLDGIL